MLFNNQMRYNLMDNLYCKWIDEKDVFKQKQIKDEIIRSFSKIEILEYSALNTNMPFETFRNIFSLNDMFEAIIDMKKQGIDISNLTKQIIQIETIEDASVLINLSQSNKIPEFDNFYYMISPKIAFNNEIGRKIAENYEKVHVDNMPLEQIEMMIGNGGTQYKGIPITIKADNVSLLSVEKLEKIQRKFDIEAVRIDERENNLGYLDKRDRMPLNIKAYKQVRRIIDDIIKELYIDDKADKMHVDFQLAIQVIQKLAGKLQYDHKAKIEPFDSYKRKTSSGLASLITGKALCNGYSEILRNVLSCVGVECINVEGRDQEGQPYTWNQVKLGDRWFNVDLTLARNNVYMHNETGDLFMSDATFMGERRKITFDKGKMVNGKKMETRVTIGGHDGYIYGSKHNKCEKHIPPNLTYSLMERTRQYPAMFRRSQKIAIYDSVIPYIGSKTEKRKQEEVKMEQIRKNIEKNNDEIEEKN